MMLSHFHDAIEDLNREIEDSIATPDSEDAGCETRKTEQDKSSPHRHLAYL
jgi:hypothetical protein